MSEKAPQEIDMALTLDFKETVMARARRDPAFRGALLIEATDAFLAGDIDTGVIPFRRKD